VPSIVQTDRHASRPRTQRAGVGHSVTTRAHVNAVRGMWPRLGDGRDHHALLESDTPPHMIAS